ncbi:sensor histidine kinase [Streptomyces vinaceus]|uniref:sensor histidine kinase n=1 Tax=Streptomyces vinaceus TaxID=1960 RepID=UPI003800C2A2
MWRPNLSEQQEKYRRENLRMLLRTAMLAVLALALAVPVQREDSTLYVRILVGYALCLLVATTIYRSNTALWRRSYPARLVFAVTMVLIDLVTLVGLTLVSGGPYSIVFQAFFIIPVVAAFSQYPPFTITVAFITAVAYLAVSLHYLALHHEDATLQLQEFLIRLGALLVVCTACAYLSVVHRARDARIQTLVDDRSQLLRESMDAAERERRKLAEQLHDGALQNILAARHLIEEAAEAGSAEQTEEAFGELDTAIVEVARQIRAAVYELHPLVLEEAGLCAALQTLARDTAHRGRLEVITDVRPVPPVHQNLLFGVARELLDNVVRHAQATVVRVSLADVDACTELEITDDGKGVSPAVLAQRVAEGHIGVASQRVRVDSAGGEFRLVSEVGQGTSVRIRIPNA